LILGADAAAGVLTWHAPEAVLRRAHLAVMDRPGVERRAVEAAAAGAVQWLHTPLLGVSGTLLRARHRAGLSLRFLVPEAVLAYIESAGLYARARRRVWWWAAAALLAAGLAFVAWAARGPLGDTVGGWPPGCRTWR